MVTAKAPNWTAHNGHSNTSPTFERLCDAVERIIRNGAADLIAGDAGSVARTIMAQLAHRHNLVPFDDIDVVRSRLISDGFLQRDPDRMDGLDVRTANCLFNMAKRHPWAPCCEGLPPPTTVAYLLKYSGSILLSYPGFGRKSLQNLSDVLASYGLKLTPELSEIMQEVQSDG